jgi:PTH1 family peptidyl-tRNA hydrolase
MGGQSSGGRQLVVGLGNPGPDYAATRHNAGFMVLDELATRVGGGFTSSRGRVADVLEGQLAGRAVVLMKPRSFMNTSGGPVSAVARFYKVAVESITVVHDELDLPFGTVRLKRGGGEGGHNGLKSIAQSLASKDFARVRVGIGRPPGRQDPADFVLRPFAVLERRELDHLIGRAADAVEALLQDGLEAAQNVFHA